MSLSPADDAWILPVGTRVVTRTALQRPHGGELLPAGAVGIVVKAPADPLHAYRVKFPDGLEVALTRARLSCSRIFRAGPSAKRAVVARICSIM